ncbi:MAG TPA: (2Fe-2S)-binding protein [Reyranella sp.]|jgi:isoquinoline 1-oxidoreductase alpha subunit|nr:(2Fe-2S)-binding protein [Reyranella sp.]
MISLRVNGKWRDVDASDDKPLLWVLREDLDITGPKFGCGVAACGACTVHIDGEAVRSCSLPASAAAGKAVVTIEGLGEGLDGDKLHPVQRAWIEEQVPQCGYCQPGFIMATAALLRSKPKPTDQEIDDALTNICRCGTYSALRRAVHRAAALMAGP